MGSSTVAGIAADEKEKSHELKSAGLTAGGTDIARAPKTLARGARHQNLHNALRKARGDGPVLVHFLASVKVEEQLTP